MTGKKWDRLKKAGESPGQKPTATALPPAALATTLDPDQATDASPDAAVATNPAEIAAGILTQEEHLTDTEDSELDEFNELTFEDINFHPGRHSHFRQRINPFDKNQGIDERLKAILLLDLGIPEDRAKAADYFEMKEEWDEWEEENIEEKDLITILVNFYSVRWKVAFTKNLTVKILECLEGRHRLIAWIMIVLGSTFDHGQPFLKPKSLSWDFFRKCGIERSRTWRDSARYFAQTKAPFDVLKEAQDLMDYKRPYDETDGYNPCGKPITIKLFSVKKSDELPSNLEAMQFKETVRHYSKLQRKVKKSASDTTALEDLALAINEFKSSQYPSDNQIDPDFKHKDAPIAFLYELPADTASIEEETITINPLFETDEFSALLEDPSDPDALEDWRVRLTIPSRDVEHDYDRSVTGDERHPNADEQQLYQSRECAPPMMNFLERIEHTFNYNRDQTESRLKKKPEWPGSATANSFDSLSLNFVHVFTTVFHCLSKRDKLTAQMKRHILYHMNYLGVSNKMWDPRFSEARNCFDLKDSGAHYAAKLHEPTNLLGSAGFLTRCYLACLFFEKNSDRFYSLCRCLEQDEAKLGLREFNKRMCK